MPTIPDPLTRNLQVAVTEDAAIRIKVTAARKGTSAGRVISELAAEHLPADSVVEPFGK